MTPTPLPPGAPPPGATAEALRALRTDVLPARDLWPGIAARLERRPATAAAPLPAGVPRPAPARGWRHPRRRRNAGYALAATVVLAVAVAWQLAPVRTVAPPADAGDGLAATPPASAPATDAPLLRAADALALEYQGALREARAASGAAALPAGLDAELERGAAEVRAALARDPDALYLFNRLQRIYAHRLDLTLRQA